MTERASRLLTVWGVSVELGQQLLCNALACGTGGRLALLIEHAHDTATAFALNQNLVATQLTIALVIGPEQA